jgi:thiosulfate dehydrogenase [quinone] large subunit
MATYSVHTIEGHPVKNPSIVRFFFNDPRTAPFWAVLRVLVGLQWLNIALPKLSNPGWMETGAIVQGFWQAQLRIPESGPPPIIYGWYRDLLQGLMDNGSYVWMARIIAITEVTLGILLVTGALVGAAGLLAAFLHWNYLMAGSAGNNGLMFPAAVLLIAAWKVAGYYGLDRFIIPRLARLWSPRPAQSNMQDRQSQGTA